MFRTDEEAAAFLDDEAAYLQEQDRSFVSGQAPPPLNDVELAQIGPPPGPMPDLAPLPGEEPIMREDLYGNLPPDLMQEEPPLPVAVADSTDEPLPPVQTRSQDAPGPSLDFSSDEAAAAFLEAPGEAMAPEDKQSPPADLKFETDKAAADFLETLPPAPGPAGSSQLAYDTTVRPENVEGPIPFGEQDRPYRTRHLQGRRHR